MAGKAKGKGGNATGAAGRPGADAREPRKRYAQNKSEYLGTPYFGPGRKGLARVLGEPDTV